MLLLYIFSVLLFTFLVVRYFATSRAVCRSTTRLAGKVVVITGGNSGIGRCTAIDLAKRGAKVYIASEVSVPNGEAAAKYIQLESGNPAVYFQKLDLSCMRSVTEFARNILELENQIHALINNAGVYLHRRSSTEDGFEATLAINYVGHVLLTLLLLERMKCCAPSRILLLTSVTHRCGSLDFDDMMLTKKYYLPLRAYSRSKLAILMFARELERKLVGCGVTVCTVDPGLVDTDIITSNTIPAFAKMVLYAVRKLIFMPPSQGAQTSIYCAVSEEVEGASGFYNDCRKKSPSVHALDNDQSVKLWNYTINLLKPYLKEADSGVLQYCEALN